MGIAGLDHVNIRTHDLAHTLAFYRDVLQMPVTPRPGKSDTADSAWILDGKGHPVLHITSDDKGAREGSGTIDHIALNCTDHPAMVDRLRERAPGFTQNEIPSIGLQQIFVRDPNGILIELNFREG